MHGDAYSGSAVYEKDSGTGKEEILYIGRDYAGSITHLIDATGTIVEENSYTAWGWMRDPATLKTYKPYESRSLRLGRGFTGHEHIIEFGLINMNARLYDPVTGRFLSPDPYVPDAFFSQTFNRYSYALNNPLKYTDPSGEFLFTIMSLIIPGGQSFLPAAIGADIGMWSGGSMANGTLNPFKWDYSSAKTWGYMAGGAIAGGTAGYMGGLIFGSGIAGANTLSIASGSLINSLGTWAYTGGVTNISIGFGIRSYNFYRKIWLSW